MSTTTTSEKTVRVPSERVVRLQRAIKVLSSLDLSKVEVCCSTHMEALVSICETARKGGLTERQMNFGRDILMKRANHRSARVVDPNRQVEVRCTHGEMVDKKYVRCTTVVTGTPVEVGTKGNRCDKHQVVKEDKKDS